MTQFTTKAIAALALVLGMSSANATLMDVNFTASGPAIGGGDFIVDSSLFVANAFYQGNTALVQSLSLSLDFGQGATHFSLSDLTGAGYYFRLDDVASVIDLNFWGANADGVTLQGVSIFHDYASGALGANGQVIYAIQSVTPYAAVPEPGTIALFGLGLLGFAALRRRKL